MPCWNPCDLGTQLVSVYCVKGLRLHWVLKEPSLTHLALAWASLPCLMASSLVTISQYPLYAHTIPEAYRAPQAFLLSLLQKDSLTRQWGL